MPKALFLHRPSGLYARFLVPADLRAQVGSRFLVRSLHLPPGDAARLAAARLGLALSDAFDTMRRGRHVDLKKALKAANDAGVRDWSVQELTLPNGTTLRGLQVDGPEDAERFSRHLEDIGRLDGPVVAAPSILAAKDIPWLSVAIEVHLADLITAQRDPKTVTESRHTLRLFVGVVGDRSPADLTQDHARAFLSAVEFWPNYATHRTEYRGRSVSEVLRLSKLNGEPRPSDHTLSKHRQRLSVFIHWLMKARYLAHNPMDGIPTNEDPKSDEVTEVETGRPFTSTELQAIFSPVTFLPWASKYPHRFWGPVLGLYTGARVTEVAQLYVKDVEMVDGVPGLRIERRFLGQKLKNKSFRRFVPLAQPVLDAGFLGFVEEVKKAGHVRLFPDLPNGTGLGYGRQLSRQFSTYIKRSGVDEAGLGFHAFRHTLVTRLEDAGEDETAIARLTGHFKQSQSVLAQFYMKRVDTIDRKTLPSRVESLAKFVPPVELPIYTPGQFAQAFKDARPETAKPRRERSPVPARETKKK